MSVVVSKYPVSTEYLVAIVPVKAHLVTLFVRLGPERRELHMAVCARVEGSHCGQGIAIGGLRERRTARCR